MHQHTILMHVADEENRTLRKKVHELESQFITKNESLAAAITALPASEEAALRAKLEDVESQLKHFQQEKQMLQLRLEKVARFANWRITGSQHLSKDHLIDYISSSGTSRQAVPKFQDVTATTANNRQMFHEPANPQAGDNQNLQSSDNGDLAVKAAKTLASPFQSLFVHPNSPFNRPILSPTLEETAPPCKKRKQGERSWAKTII